MGLQLASVGLLQPLRHSAGELRQIAGIFPSATKVFEQNAAVESALHPANLRRTRILHFATHGLIDESHPDRSGLALTAAPPNVDGVLQVREVYKLELPGSLVTLSACQTALGKLVTGEGIVGLTRAFFYAGANTVLASLWNVNDASTARLMTGFYEGLGRGEPIDRALRQAKLAFLRGDDARLRHPYYWAPFVAIGHGAREIEVRRSPAWRLIGLGLLFAVMLTAAYLASRARKRREVEEPA
jgi:CHAT domain-containing protein